MYDIYIRDGLFIWETLVHVCLQAWLRDLSPWLWCSLVLRLMSIGLVQVVEWFNLFIDMQESWALSDICCSWFDAIELLNRLVLLFLEEIQLLSSLAVVLRLYLLICFSVPSSSWYFWRAWRTKATRKLMRLTKVYLIASNKLHFLEFLEIKRNHGIAISNWVAWFWNAWIGALGSGSSPKLQSRKLNDDSNPAECTWSWMHLEGNSIPALYFAQEVHIFKLGTSLLSGFYACRGLVSVRV